MKQIFLYYNNEVHQVEKRDRGIPRLAADFKNVNNFNT